MQNATIYSMAFGPPDPSKLPDILCAASDSGTVHIFKMPGKNTFSKMYADSQSASPGRNITGSIIAAVSPTMIDVYEAVRCSVSIKLPFKTTMSVAVFQKSADDSYRIGVFSYEGILYEYNVVENWDADWTANMRRELLIRRSGELKENQLFDASSSETRRGEEKFET